jgi:Tfp pilus assembly protein PilF
MFWPLNLATPYLYPAIPQFWQVVGAASLMLCITVLAFWGARRYPYLLVGWMWYLITLIPTTGLVGIGPKIMADRYTYLPLIGLFIMMVWGLPDLVKSWPYRRTVLSLSAGIVLSGTMICSWLQVRHWKDSIALSEHSIEVTENNYKSYTNLGLAQARKGRFYQAIDSYTAALNIDPYCSLTHYNLGILLDQLERYEEAISHYNMALRYNPDMADVHNSIGVTLMRQGKYEDAIGYFSEAVRINPNLADAHNNYGTVLANQGKFLEAIDYFSKALTINPGLVSGHCNLAKALAVEGRLEEAVDHYTKALTINPHMTDIHFNLGSVLARQGRFVEAIGHFDKALQINPNLEEARSNREYILKLMDKSTGP